MKKPILIFFDKKRFIPIAVLFAIVLSGCAHLAHFHAAQDAFSRGAEIENAAKMTQSISDASPDAYYNLAYAEVQKALKYSGKLEADGLVGNAFSLQALCEWKLKKYQKARKSAQSAITHLDDEVKADAYLPRDLAVMKALDGLIGIDVANDALRQLSDVSDFAATKGRYSEFYFAEGGEGGVQKALAALEKISGEVSPNHEVRAYLALSMMAGLKVWSDALNEMKQSMDAGSTAWSLDEKRTNYDWYDAQNEIFQGTKSHYFDLLGKALPRGKEHPAYQYWLLLMGGN